MNCLMFMTLFSYFSTAAGGEKGEPSHVHGHRHLPCAKEPSSSTRGCARADSNPQLSRTRRLKGYFCLFTHYVVSLKLIVIVKVNLTTLFKFK